MRERFNAAAVQPANALSRPQQIRSGFLEKLQAPLKAPLKTNKALALGSLFFMGAHGMNAHADKSDIEIAGDVLQFLVPVAAGVDIYSREDEERWEKLKDLGVTIAISQATTLTLKEAFYNTDLGTRPRDRELGKHGGRNFPSGHTTGACAPAIHHLHEYGDLRSGALMAGCLFTGYSRMHAKAHDMKAVIGAIVVSEGAYQVNKNLTQWFQRKSGNDNASMSVQPFIESIELSDRGGRDEVMGMSVQIRF